jgi:hypothetical protein
MLLVHRWRGASAHQVFGGLETRKVSLGRRKNLRFLIIWPGG